MSGEMTQIISESPEPYEDAAMMKKVVQTLQEKLKESGPNAIKSAVKQAKSE